MKVMTFNIWNYTRPWRERRQQICDLISAHTPDAVCLQETRHDFRFERGRGQGEQIAQLTAYHATFLVGQVYLPILRIDEGVTILTREPPARIMRRELSMLPHERDDQNQRVCLGVTLVSAGREVDVYNTHWSLSERARESNAREVAAFIAEQSGSRPALVMGDFNAEPETAPIRFMLGGESHDDRSGDFVDCWAASNPEQPGYTYASFDPVRRIDYVMARNLTGRVRGAVVVGAEPVRGVYPSDHLGIVVDVDL